MDGVIVIILAAVLYFVYWPLPEQHEKAGGSTVPPITLVKNPTLNPEMIHDEHAFMEIAYELGFR